MKIAVHDAEALKAFKAKIDAWVTEQSRGRLRNVDRIVVVKTIEEHPVYRVTYKVQTESRSVTKFNRADSTPVGPADPSFNPSSFDPWSVQCEKVDNFNNFRQTVDIPPSLKAIQCRTCMGSGKSPCPECNGQSAVYCPECRGDGKKVCPDCRKSKKVQCHACNGRGKVYNDIKQDYDLCPECGGSRDVPCTTCHEGYIKCENCGGKGRLPCKLCGGTGALDCKACSGKGQIITGMQVEVLFRPFEEKAEIPNEEVPPEVLGGVGAALSFASEKFVDDDPDGTIDGVLSPLLGAIEPLRKKITAPKDARVVRSGFSVEKKSLYLLHYAIGETENQVWFSEPEGKFTCEPKLLNEIYAGTVKDIYARIKKDDIDGALTACGRIGEIAALDGEVKKIRAAVRSRILRGYCIGAFAGCLLLSGGLLPLLYQWRGASFHVVHLLALAALVNIVVAVLAAVTLFMVQPRILNRSYKRIAGSLACVIAVLGALYGAGYVAGFDPARYLDARQMNSEYRQYFPFGLRTLASREDIEFLANLVAKYEETDIDLTAVKKDLEWMRSKLATDESTIQRIDKTLNHIEKVQTRQAYHGRSVNRLGGRGFNLHRKKSPKIIIQ